MERGSRLRVLTTLLVVSLLVVLGSFGVVVVLATPIPSNVYVDVPFEQLNSTIYQYASSSPAAPWLVLPEDLSLGVQQITPATLPNTVYILGNYSLYLFNPFPLDGVGSFELLLDDTVILPGSRIIANFPWQGKPGLTLLATPKGHYVYCFQTSSLVNCSDFQTVSVSFDFGSVAAIALAPLAGLIGSSQGFFYLDAFSGDLTQEYAVNGTISSVAFIPPGDIAVGTNMGVWRSLGSYGGEWYRFEIPGIIDGPISYLSVNPKDNSLWIGNDVCINIMYSNLTMERVGYQDGLIYGNITAIDHTCSSGSVWVGSSQLGAFRLPSAASRSNWKYFFSSRWFPAYNANSNAGSDVIALTCVPISPDTTTGNVSEVVLVVTSGGIAALHYNQITLAEKAEILEGLMSPRHFRYGQVGDCGLQTFGNLSSWFPQTNDNNGLWSSIYLVAECFRYAVTQDPEAKANAWTVFEAMEFLNNVTGIKGLMARSFAKFGDPGSSGYPWYNSTAYPGWVWKGDTSSDEVTGHMFAYGVFYDLVAETPEEKERPYNLINNIMHYIVENNFTLIDITGLPTTWGKWSPKWLNEDPDWYDERGLNSLQILTWLLQAYRITQDSYFLDAYDLLVTKYGYAINLIDAKITQPTDDNYSDDELTFLPYFVYIWNSPKIMDQAFNRSIDRTFSIVKPEKPALYNFIYGAHVGGVLDFDLAGAVECMQQLPLSWIDWAYMNSERLDVVLDRYSSRQGDPISQNPLPWDESVSLRWNGANYQLDQLGGGNSETEPSMYLLPYWMARYYGFISAPQY